MWRPRRVGRRNRAQFVLSQAERLFHEYVLAGLQRLQYETGMSPVPRSDEHRIGAGVVKDIVVIRGPARDLEPLCQGIRADARRGADPPQVNV